jgi:hypothetical protein
MVMGAPEPDEIAEAEDEARRGIYGTPGHWIPQGERDMHVALPECLCGPIRKDRHDGATLWTHRVIET